MFSEEYRRNCEIFAEQLKVFEVAMSVHRPAAVMTAYNACNGCYCAQDEELLQGILRREFGFEGFVMTDWTSYDTADIASAIAAGNCWMTPGTKDDTYVKPILDGLENGTIDEKRFQKKCRISSWGGFEAEINCGNVMIGRIFTICSEAKNGNTTDCPRRKNPGIGRRGTGKKKTKMNEEVKTLPVSENRRTGGAAALTAEEFRKRQNFLKNRQVRTDRHQQSFRARWFPVSETLPCTMDNT